MTFPSDNIGNNSPRLPSPDANRAHTPLFFPDDDDNEYMGNGDLAFGSDDDDDEHLGNDDLAFSSDSECDRFERLAYPEFDELESIGSGDDSISNPSTEEDSEDGDIENDPGFIPYNRLFDPYYIRDDNHLLNDQAGPPYHNPVDVPAAFHEHPSIRNAYIRAFVMATFKGATHDIIKIHLDGVYASLAGLAEPIPGLDNMARTYHTVEKRLNVSFEDFIMYYVLCPICWRVYPPTNLYRFDSPNCEDESCDGILFRSKRLSDGTLKRIPTKVFPFVPPDRAIARWLLRPGKYEQLQHWRHGDDDLPRQSPPLHKINYSQGFNAFADPSTPLDDITDGWGWRNLAAGCKRIRMGPWEIQDVSNIDQRFVNLPCGLVWQINIDW